MSEETIENIDIQEEKEIVIGEFKTLDKFVEFVGGKSNINFISKEAILDIKYLTGSDDYAGTKFKLVICDEGTVDFEEIETTSTTKEQRQRLLDTISDKTIAPYRGRMVVMDLKFTVDRDDIKFPVYLAVDYIKPINKLASIFDDVDESIEVEVSDSQSEKLDFLMGLFDEEKVEEKVEEKSSVEEKEAAVVEYNSIINESFAKMKEAKALELKNRISGRYKDISKFESDVKMSQKKVEEAKGDVELLQSRLDGLGVVREMNGYLFNISEQMNEKIHLDEDMEKIIRSKVSKVKGIRVDAFMKLFEAGEYQIKLATISSGVITEVEDYSKLPKDIVDRLSMMQDISIIDNRLIYTGDLVWHDIVSKLDRFGFEHRAEIQFDVKSEEVVEEIEKVEEKNEIDMTLKKFEGFSVDADGNLNMNDEGYFGAIQDKEDSKIHLEEFEDDYGYEMGNDFIFSIIGNNTASNCDYWVCITPKSYWDNEGCAYDQHIGYFLNLPEPPFDEASEATFMYHGKSIDCISDLVNRGIKFNKGFNDYCTVPQHGGSEFEIDGISLSDYMIKNYPNSIV